MSGQWSYQNTSNIYGLSWPYSPHIGVVWHPQTITIITVITIVTSQITTTNIIIKEFEIL